MLKIKEMTEDEKAIKKSKILKELSEAHIDKTTNSVLLMMNPLNKFKKISPLRVLSLRDQLRKL